MRQRNFFHSVSRIKHQILRVIPPKFVYLLTFAAAFAIFIIYSRREAFLAVNGRARRTYKEPYVYSAVHFPGFVLLLYDSPQTLKGKDKVHCWYNGEVETEVLEMEPGMVRCMHPSTKAWRWRSLTGRAVTISVDGVLWETDAVYSSHEAWKSLVYSGAEVPKGGEGGVDEVLLFVKGIVTEKKERKPDQADLRCVFGDPLSRDSVETEVTGACQEGIRCRLPPQQVRDQLARQPITVKWKQTALPTVLRYHEGSLLKWGDAEKRQPKYEICACTSIFNGAKFLREWVMYHARIGVSRWLLYDNNSEDDIKDVVASLGAYNVTRHVWPWLKTQEAAFSHCSLRAQSEGCTWVGFFDVDEFFFLKAFTAPKQTPLPEGRTLLQELIAKSPEKVEGQKELGQVSVRCVNFGPSGLKQLKPGGQMLSYTCRETKVNRHKSLVLVKAMDETRCNIIHHFDLRSGFGSAEWRKAQATVNHYKYPVWEDFAPKFVRRVATYVTDWDQEEKLESKDRVEGLGTRPVEPPDWSERFCEEEDKGLHDYVVKEFMDPETKKLPWEI